MLLGELVAVSWRAIAAHKLRSFLTLLGVIIGVMTVVAVVADEDSLKKPVKTKKGPPPTPAPAISSAAKKQKEIEGVFVVGKDGLVQFKKIKTGITAELDVEVTEGLEGGEEIVTGPFKALRGLKIGDKVKVDNTPAGAGSGERKS